MAPAPGHIPFAIARERLSSVVAITDPELERAVSYAFQRLKYVVEPGSAAGLAALLAGKVDIRPGGAIAVVLTGGNCDVATVARCVAAVTDP
jgi:threonine dehydratase